MSDPPRLWRLALRYAAESGPPPQFVVPAATEAKARRLAREYARILSLDGPWRWLDPLASTCEEVTAEPVVSAARFRKRRRRNRDD